MRVENDETGKASNFPARELYEFYFAVMVIDGVGGSANRNFNWTVLLWSKIWFNWNWSTVHPPYHITDACMVYGVVFKLNYPFEWGGDFLSLK